MWTELHRNSEVRILKVEYTVQQDASLQHNELLVVNIRYSEAEDKKTHVSTIFFPCISVLIFYEPLLNANINMN
jgi:hypothetical protein